MTEQRKQGMEATRKKLKNELKRLRRKLELSRDFDRLVFALPQKKFSDLSIRGFFAHAMFEYIREQARQEGIKIRMTDRKRLFDTHLPFIFELIISVQYLANQILDGKGGVLRKRKYNLNKIRDNTIAGSYLKDVLYQYIETTVFPEDLGNRTMVQEYVRRSFQMTDEGQRLEKRYSSYKNFKKGFDPLPPVSGLASRLIDHDLIDRICVLFRQEGLSESCEPFARFYLQRIYCTNASPFCLMTELILALTGYDGAERDRLLRFAREFGMLAQMTNDLTDLLPMTYEQDTIAKIPEDAYSDLRNDNITLPLIFFLDKNPNYSYKTLRHNLDTAKKQHAVFELLTPLCRDTLIPFLQEWAENCRWSNLTRNNTFYNLLGDITSIVRSPRYLKHFGKVRRRKSKRHQIVSPDLNNPFVSLPP